MSLKADGCRHRAIGGFLTTALRQQGTQPQHRDIACRPAKINWQIFHPVDGGLSFREIAVAAAL
jgi:hypothetical protein